MFKTLTDAIELATFAHKYQVDKSGFAYVEHPKRVLAAVQAQGAPPFVQIAAVLHDVAEDTPFNHHILKDLGFSEAVTHLVWILSRKIYKQPGTGKTDDFYYFNIKVNPWAKMIKFADIADNTLEWRLSYLEQETQDRLRAKYAHALEVLGD